MIIADQKLTPHNRHKRSSNIHTDTDNVVADINENKVSCYLSAGYSAPVLSIFPMHPWNRIKSDDTNRRKNSSF
jgi:5-formyltetrahydrofolate cyclo-ligase